MRRFDSQPAQNNLSSPYKLGQVITDLDMRQWNAIQQNPSVWYLLVVINRATLLCGDPEVLRSLSIASSGQQDHLFSKAAVQQKLGLKLGDLEILFGDSASDSNSWPPNSWPLNTGFVSQLAEPKIEQLVQVVYRQGDDILVLEELLPHFRKVLITSNRVEEAEATSFNLLAYSSLAEIQQELAAWAARHDPKIRGLFFSCAIYAEYPNLSSEPPGSRWPVLLETEEDWRKVSEGFNTFRVRYELALQGEGTQEEQQEAAILQEDTFADRPPLAAGYYVSGFDPDKWEVKKME